MNLPAARTPSGGEVTRAKAAELSKSKLMPTHFYDNPANVQYVMEIGRALGIDPVSALSHVHVFPDGDGKLKCGLSADLMVALARAAGHKVYVTGNQVKATATLIRYGEAKTVEAVELAMKQVEYLKAMGIDPKEVNVFTEVWTADRATQIGLMKKFNWKTYTPEMLKARVKSAVVRTGASEVLIGITQILQAMGVDLSDSMDDEIAITSARYTADELGAETDEDGVPIQGRNLNKVPQPAKAAIPQVPMQIIDYVNDTSGEAILAYVKGLVDEGDGTSVKERVVKINMIGAALRHTGKDTEMVGVMEPGSDELQMVTLFQAVGAQKNILNNS